MTKIIVKEKQKESSLDSTIIDIGEYFTGHISKNNKPCIIDYDSEYCTKEYNINYSGLFLKCYGRIVFLDNPIISWPVSSSLKIHNYKPIKEISIFFKY